MKTILVVEDMPIFREPIEAVLRAEGFNTIGVSNGQEAIYSLAKRIPDLIILDLGLPVLDGLAVLRHVRTQKNLQKVPVIVLSAEADRARVLQAIKLGIAGYLLKANFSLKDLLNKVRELLGESARNDDRSPVPAATPKVASTSALPAPEKAGADKAATVSNTKGAPAPSVLAPVPAADLKSLKPVMTRAELLDRVKACEELKGFSPTVTQVLNLTASETCSIDAVSKAVRQDQAMALKILKVANSSAYSRGDRVDNVNKAILRIGLQSIRQVVLSIAVVENFSSPAFGEQISTRNFWEHSIACGIIAAELAHELGDPDADSAFTSGLLHDLGRVILAEALGKTYVETIETARRLGAPLEAVESRMLLINHADIMDRLLGAWHFPKHLVDPIMFHHLSAGTVRSVAPTRTREVLRLGLANRLAHAMLLGGSGNDIIYPTEEHCRVLNIDPKTIERIGMTAREQTDDTKFALLSNAGSGVWPRLSDELRSRLSSPFRPLFISAHADFDAYRIFCRELAGPSGDGPPNLAIVHIANAKERGMLAERLVSEEQKTGVRALPVLMLSPAGLLALDNSVLQGRLSAVVTTPTPVSQFVATVNTLIAPSALEAAA